MTTEPHALPEANSQSLDAAATPMETPIEVSVFRISPVIRLTLLSLYVALTLPLPFLAEATAAPVPAIVLWIGIGLGAIALYGALSERVIVNQQGIQVAYPAWFAQFLRKGWCLDWSEITALKPRTTGQGGLVYYFLSTSGKAYLLPMRIVGFARFVRIVEAQTGIDTTDVRPLAQPWMYFILLGFTLMLLAIDSWTIWTVFAQGREGYL